MVELISILAIFSKPVFSLSALFYGLLDIYWLFLPYILPRTMIAQVIWSWLLPSSDPLFLGVDFPGLLVVLALTFSFLWFDSIFGHISANWPLASLLGTKFCIWTLAPRTTDASKKHFYLLRRPLKFKPARLGLSSFPSERRIGELLLTFSNVIT